MHSHTVTQSHPLSRRVHVSCASATCIAVGRLLVRERARMRERRMQRTHSSRQGVSDPAGRGQERECVPKVGSLTPCLLLSDRVAGGKNRRPSAHAATVLTRAISTLTVTNERRHGIRWLAHATVTARSEIRFQGEETPPGSLPVSLQPQHILIGQ
jgi:hypothetical protein